MEDPQGSLENKKWVEFSSQIAGKFACACGSDLSDLSITESVTELTLIDPRHIDPYYTTWQCEGTSEYLCCPARTAHSSVKIHTSTIYTHLGVDTMWFLFQVNCPFTLANRPFDLSQYWAQHSKASWQVSSKISPNKIDIPKLHRTQPLHRSSACSTWKRRSESTGISAWMAARRSSSQTAACCWWSGMVSVPWCLHSTWPKRGPRSTSRGTWEKRGCKS